MKKHILTVGPSLLDNINLNEVHDSKNIYRINGAHGSIADIENKILKIRDQVQDAAILLDLPGNKVRTKDIGKINLEKGKTFEISSKSFNYEGFYNHLKPGQTAWANDSVFEFEVVSADKDKIVFLSKSNGVLIDNKGIHIRDIHDGMPFLFDKDREIIGMANKHTVSYIGLSFVRKPEDVKEAASLLNKNTSIISKIETIEAVKNLTAILDEVEYILIDRGDLSTDIGIENIPYYQNFIIEKALYYDKKIFLATQVLKHMEHYPIPTIAEICDLYTILKKGVYGLQLSEETAVGNFVFECLDVLNKIEDTVSNESLIF